MRKNIFHSTNINLFLCVILAVGLLLYPLSAWGFFSGEQAASGQTFSAGFLSLEDVDPPNTLTVTPDGATSTNFTIQTAGGSVPAQYDLAVTGTSASGDGDLCAALEMSVTAPSGLLGTSTVSGYQSPAQSVFGDWELTFSTKYEPADGNGSACTIIFLADTWNEQMYKGAGFVDQQEFTLTVQYGETSGASITTSTVVLNEIYAASGSTLDEPFNTEWVELFNLGTETVDVEGWSIGELWSDNEQLHNISVANTCEPGALVGYARPVQDTDDTSIEPGGFLVIEPCSGQSRIASGGDTISLYNAENELQDTVTYQSLAFGQALARVPDGDGTWEKQQPTPNATNVLINTQSFGMFAMTDGDNLFDQEVLDSEQKDKKKEDGIKDEEELKEEEEQEEEIEEEGNEEEGKEETEQEEGKEEKAEHGRVETEGEALNGEPEDENEEKGEEESGNDGIVRGVDEEARAEDEEEPEDDKDSDGDDDEDGEDEEGGNGEE